MIDAAVKWEWSLSFASLGELGLNIVGVTLSNYCHFGGVLEIVNRFKSLQLRRCNEFSDYV